MISLLALWPFIKAPHPQTHALSKPILPEPVVTSLGHPWLARQPGVQGAECEITRDLEKVKSLSHLMPELNLQEVTQVLIRTLVALQKEIPFTFPEHLYNVLCICETEIEAPAPFHVFKRLYLGESELGLPFYLDVRVFDLKDHTAQEIKEWHLSLIKGSSERLSGDRWICRGKREAALEATHGFAALQGDRGLFLNCIEKEGKLFVCYAEAPLSTFTLHEPLFRSL